MTFAPLRPGQAEVLANLMESVEDIPASAILDGLSWDWETYGQYLDAIDGLPRLYNRVAGKTWAPNQIQPRWLIEGLATYEESKRSAGGRTRHALFDAELRMATLRRDERGLDEISHGPRVYPHGNAAYLYGSHFLKYVFDRYGDDKAQKMTWDYGRNPIPWGLNQTSSTSLRKLISATGPG